MEKIREEKFIQLEELISLLDTSESTIRRDLDELEAHGKLRRVHGGAEALSNLQSEESMQQKSVKNIQSKQALARHASQLIEAGDVIFLDAGTTTELLIGELNPADITVVTNSIHHASKLTDRQIPTMIIGGRVKLSTDASIGPLAVEQIGQLHFDKAFLGMNGVDEEYFTTPDMEEAIIKKTVLENSKESYVLVDDSKMGQISFVKVAPITKAIILTNSSKEPLVEKLRKKTRVIEV